MTLLCALHAEALKLKRTLALRLAILLPIVMAGLQFLMTWQNGIRLMFDGETPWIRFMQQTLVFWCLLMLPLFVTLETALLAGMEHSNRQWKHLFSLRVPRGAIYAAKQTVALALIGVSMAVLAASTLIAGWGLRLLLPGGGFEAPPPRGTFLARCLMVYLSAWLLVAIQTWTSLRWRSFVVAVSAGIVLTVAGMFIVNAKWGHLYPWALPGLIANDFSKGAAIPAGRVLFGSLGGLLVAVLGGWEMTRQDVT
jgi:hypothetical protein